MLHCLPSALLVCVNDPEVDSSDTTLYGSLGREVTGGPHDA